MNEWVYKGDLFESDDIGEYQAFVYRITNRSNGHFYIGKKFFWKTITRPPLKGKKRKRKEIKESDWKTYHGSSNALLLDIEEFGHDAFEREIIYLCTTKAEAAYMELWYQMKENVLFRNDSYNGIISVRIGANAVKAVKDQILNETKNI